MVDVDDEFVCTVPAVGYDLAFIDEEGIVDRLPVLSFMIMRHKYYDRGSPRCCYSIFPVTEETIHTDDSETQSYILIRPDGKVDEPARYTHESVEEFLRAKRTRLPKSGF